ncbi:OVARIAN TUMOR DOMAIN-containing deubiquitinating enzyme 9-like protein [Drosera capensis]
MTTYDSDQDGSRWLGLLDACPLFSSHYGSENRGEHSSIYDGHYSGQYHYDVDRLYQNFEQINIDGAAESSYAVDNEMHSSHPYWHSSPSTTYYHVYEDASQEVDDVGPSSSCSSPEERSYDDIEYSYSLDLMDESTLDGEIGKRLNQLIPVPHVPRINGEIPSVNEASSDHQRLLDRLQVYDLVERKVQGDGNCQFCALSDQFYRTPDHHKFTRRQVVNQLKSHREYYEGYVPMEYDEYLKKMSKGGEWGDHVTLQAAADSYGLKIFVITSFKDTCYIEILPKVQRSNRVILLSFWAEVHYNSIYPEGELPLPPLEVKKKKRGGWLHKLKP